MSVLSDLKAKKAAEEANKQPGATENQTDANQQNNSAKPTNPALDQLAQEKLPVHDAQPGDPNENISQAGNANTVLEVVKSGEDVHLYSSPTADGFSLQLSSGDVRAVAGLIKATPAQHEEIQALLRSGRPDIAQNLVLLDVAAAERVAKAHIAATTAQAGRGANHSGAGAERNHTIMEVKPVVIPGASAALNHTLTGDGRTIPVRTLDVIETDAVHADDTALQLTPEGAVPPAGPPKS